MATIDSAVYTDIKKSDSGFTFTGKLAEFAINQDWVDGYESLINKNVDANDFTSMWNAISSGTEEVGNEFYRKIRNYIDDIGNIDTCEIDALKNYASILGVNNEYINVNISFPLEIKNLINIFSVNSAYLYNKATDGSGDTLVLSNSILHYSTVEQFLGALKDKNKFAELVNNTFYNTINDFLNLKTTTFDDSKNGNSAIEIWKTDTNRFSNNLWKDDISSEYDVYNLKERLGVNKSFTEKIYADDIISGTRKIDDFSEIEQQVLNAEIKNRQTRYGNSGAMRYYYMRLYKVLEYFRFTTIAYNKAYELEEYELNENKYNILTDSSDGLTLLKFNYNEYEIDASAVRKVSEWLTDYTLNIANVRSMMKTQCQRNMMVGTKKLIVDLIRKFILEKIDGETWGDLQKSILYSAGLNRKFGVSVIEYTDMTEYFNIENPNDSVKPSDYNLNSRYWEMYNDSNNAFSHDDVLKFYNRLFDDSKKFLYNKKDGKESSDNLYEFLLALFEAGATSTTNSDYYLSSELYTASNGTVLTSAGHRVLTETERDTLAKYSGDNSIGYVPYVNYKNTFHTSYQLHPFIQAFEEYNDVYTSVMSLVNSYSENINDSFSRLTKRLDNLGNTINFWYNWNEDFSGYSTTYERGGNDFESKSGQDSPFDFSALQEFIKYPDEYINNILNGVNPYYYVSSTGKSILSENDTRLEIARLQKYSEQIRKLANREIYKYGKDYDGNIYILYKSEGNRNNRNSLGDVWVRRKGHPIAFPLFDLSLSPVRFNETSCISETDNTKLLSVLTTIVSYFKSTYGKHFTDKSILDGKVVSNNLGISVGVYTETKPVECNSDGTSSEVLFDYDIGNFNFTDNGFRLIMTSNGNVDTFASRMDYKKIYTVLDFPELSSISDSYYFVDTVTNDIIQGGNASTYIITSSDGTIEPNPTGRIISEPDEEFFNVEYNGEKSSIRFSANNVAKDNELLFAEYSDVSDFDGKFYYCTNSVTNKTHPCQKRRIKINRLYKMELGALSGEVLSNGDVNFGSSVISGDKFNGENYFSTYSTETLTESASSVLDGGLVYEDFSAYDYEVKSLGITADSSSVIIIGGSNPYYLNTQRDSHGKYFTTLEKAEKILKKDESDTIEFSDRIYRNHVKTSEISSLPFSSCMFVSLNTGSYSDSIGQFYLMDNPYVVYHPYTQIIGHPFTDSSKLSANQPSGSFTLYGEDGNTTYYYNLSTWLDDGYERAVRVRSVSYDRYSKTISAKQSRFNGGFELHPSDTVEYPIYLDFNTSSADNIATYSSYLNDREQRKFFDMGFSYNQKLFYLTYRNGNNEYTNSGTIVGSLSEKTDGNYDKTISFYRDSIHNIEYVDADSMVSSKNATAEEYYDKFHIGDASSKNGIYTAFGKYDKERMTLEVFITLFSNINVIQNKFNISLRYPLYEFKDGSKYSFKLSCTDSRLYISFTCQQPSFDELFSNTVNGATAGSIGTTRFGDIMENCFDSLIEILSFDISDADSVILMNDETRFILGNGSIGYFPQYSGFIGKNNVFTNPKLSSDTEFSFEAQFKPLTGSSTVDFYSNYGSNIVTTANESKSYGFDRFVNFYRSEFGLTDSSSITGVLINDSNDCGFVTVANSGSYGDSIRFSNIDGRGIYDISRGFDAVKCDGIVESRSKLPQIAKDGSRYMVLKSSRRYAPNSVFEYSAALSSWEFVESHENYGVHIIADRSNGSNRCGAFVDNTKAEKPISVANMNLVLIPYQTDNIGYTKFDFSEFEDFDDCIFAFHSDGKTISKINVSSRSTEFNPTSGMAVIKYNPIAYVQTFEDLPNNVRYGSIYCVHEEHDGNPSDSFYRFVYSDGGGRWEYRTQCQIEQSSIYSVISSKSIISKDGYDCNAKKGNNSCYALVNGSAITYFDAYDGEANLQISKNEMSYSGYSYRPIPFFVNDVPYVIYPVNIEDGHPKMKVCYNVDRIDKGEHGAYYITNTQTKLYSDYDAPFKSIVDTYEKGGNNIKLINDENGWIWKYDVYEKKLEKTQIFDEIDKREHLSELSDFESEISETKEHIMVSYWSNSKHINGVVRTRKNVASSIAMGTRFIDSNGNDAKIGIIAKFLSIGSVVLAEEQNNNRIFISEDDGETFNVLEVSLKNSMTLVGCGNNTFYARYGNGEKINSTDGRIWKNEKSVALSTWSVFNSNGIDYIGCIAYDKDIENGILESEKYVNVEKQFEISGDIAYDRMNVNENKDIVCCSGIDGTHSFSIARSFCTSGDYSEFEYYDFPYVRGFSFNKSVICGDDILFAPNGGLSVLKIENAFSRGKEPSISYIDISSVVNNEINVFGGFEYINGSLIMYPKDGYSILVYSPQNSSFYSMYTFDGEREFSDCDSLDYRGTCEAILSPRRTDINGRVDFSVTEFAHRNDYAIVEIDDGFPILITYTNLETYFTKNDIRSYSVSKITFRFLNDEHGKSVSILTYPTDNGSHKQFYSDKTSNYAIYVVNGTSIAYRFSSIDSSLKYKIEKIFVDHAERSHNDNYLEVEYFASTNSDRSAVGVNYVGNGIASVYGNIESEFDDYKITLEERNFDE